MRSTEEKLRWAAFIDLEVVANRMLFKDLILSDQLPPFHLQSTIYIGYSFKCIALLL